MNALAYLSDFHRFIITDKIRASAVCRRSFLIDGPGQRGAAGDFLPAAGTVRDSYADKN